MARGMTMRSIVSAVRDHDLVAREADIDVEIVLLDRRDAAARHRHPVAVGLAIGGGRGPAPEHHVDVELMVIGSAST